MGLQDSQEKPADSRQTDADPPSMAEPVPQPVTKDLIDRARTGEPAAAEQLFASAGERVLLYIRLHMGQSLRANYEPLDVLQETWLTALKLLGDFEERWPGGFSAWLCRIAENRMADLGRHGGRAKRRPPGSAVPISQMLDRARQSADGPATQVASMELAERLNAALDALEPEDREVVLLRHFQGLAAVEIARRTGSSETAVRRRLGRTLAVVGRALGEGPA